MIKERNPSQHQELFDFNVHTCIISANFMSEKFYYRIELSIPEKHENGIISVYFSEDVVCAERKVRSLINVFQSKKKTGVHLWDRKN